MTCHNRSHRRGRAGRRGASPGIGVLAACVLLAGCLGAPKETIRFLTLPPVPSDPPETSVDLSEVALGLGPSSVAPHLERRSLAYRVEDTRVEFADSAQWAAPLDEMIRDHMIARLVATTGARTLVPFPWPLARLPDVQLTVRILEFAIRPGGEGVVAAQWNLRDPSTGRGLASGDWEQTVPVQGAGTSDQVRALSRALDALTDFLAARVAEHTRE